jgi:hypothetical protein
LELTDPQKAFLDQVCSKVFVSVEEAQTQHEMSFRHLAEKDVVEVVKMTLEAGDFLLPGGGSPQRMLDDHASLIASQEKLESGQARIEGHLGKLAERQSKILDVVVGPVTETWDGVPDPDEMRDDSFGLQAQAQQALEMAQRLDQRIQNGGIPVRLPTSIKVAILGAAGTVGAAAITGTALIISALVGN